MTKLPAGTRVACPLRMQPRPLCLSCVSFEVEAVVDGEVTEAELMVCFQCQDVLYFLPDARPRMRRLGLFELYRQPG